MFIAIEGVDGVGKTTVARLLAEQLQCEFVEKLSPIAGYAASGRCVRRNYQAG